MDAARQATDSDAVLDQPVWWRRRDMGGTVRSVLLLLEPAPCQVELLELDTFEEAEKLQSTCGHLRTPSPCHL